MENSVKAVVCHTVDGISSRKSHHPERVKKDLTTRLNRIEGLIRGIKGMIDKDIYCDDVITQISATQSALNSVVKILLEGHLKGCVVDRLAEGDEELLDELVVTIQKLMKIFSFEYTLTWYEYVLSFIKGEI